MAFASYGYMPDPVRIPCATSAFGGPQRDRLDVRAQEVTIHVTNPPLPFLFGAAQARPLPNQRNPKGYRARQAQAKKSKRK